MRTTALIILSFVFNFSLQAQVTCIDLSPYTVNYLNDVSTDDVTYPPGTTFIQTGNIELVKPNTGNFYQGIQSDSLFYVGNIDIDVSNESCPNKVLTFSCAYVEGLAVDGDTIYWFGSTPSFYAGSSWEMEFDGSGLGYGDFTITGDFDVVNLLSSTNYLFDVCLECETESSSDCWTLDHLDQNDLNEISMNDSLWPAGSTFIQNGDLQIVKPSSGNFYQGVQGDSLFYVGDVDIDVSTASCEEKVLSFSCAYVEGLVVDGDTIYWMTSTPAYYQGNGWEMEFDGSGLGMGDFTITGDFDVVSLLSSTNFLFDVCLECILPSTTDCWTLDHLDQNDLNEISMNDSLWPVGSTFIQNGDLQIVKPSSGNSYQDVQGDSLFYIGDVDIDVSTASCDEKVLNFSCAYAEGLVVDGDTIYWMTSTPAYYQGNGWEMEFDGTGLGLGDFTIAGDFDVVSLLSSTNHLYDVCLECIGTANTEALLSEFKEDLIYPNPSSGKITVESMDAKTIQICSLEGRTVYSKEFNNYQSIDLSMENAGMYLVLLKTEKGTMRSYKLILD